MTSPHSRSRDLTRTSTLLSLALLAACASPAATTSSASATPVLEACAAASIPPAATLPNGFPTALPLPAGTRITGSRTSGDQLALDALVPATLAQAAEFLTRELPAAGFKITASDAEQDEAEASFSGSGVTGRFRLHGIPGCNGAVTLSIGVSPS